MRGGAEPLGDGEKEGSMRHKFEHLGRNQHEKDPVLPNRSLKALEKCRAVRGGEPNQSGGHATLVPSRSGEGARRPFKSRTKDQEELGKTPDTLPKKS